MSELKGQLLGIVLVISIFAAVGAVLVTSYKKAADTIGSQIEAPVSLYQASN